MQMIQQLTQGQQQLQQALQESASQQTQATARMAQAFQASMDQQLKIHQNVEKSIDVRDRSELKGIPKPGKFSGASGTWDSWYYKFKTWIESCHKNAIQVMQKLESTVDVAITERSLEDDYADGAELVSAQARQALISLTEGEALEIVKNTSRGTHFGLEALRRLLCKYDPQNPQANSALLKKVLHPQQCSLDKLREGLESWENLKRKYEERRKKQLEDDICRSCLQQMCPNKSQDHLDLQASRLVDYDSMKHEILAYIENVETRKEAKTGSAPMDVDSLAKSKGKGKDSKGKGKNGWSKGKGKGKNGKGKGGKDKGKGSWNHNQNQNGKGWNSNHWNQNNWNQQWNNKGKGKDKGGKSEHGDKRVAAVENAEAEGSSQTPHQPEPEITTLFALEEMAERRSRRSERSGRSRSARSEAQQALSNGEEANEEMLKDRLEKIQQVMNQAALAGLDVDPKHLEEQKTILEDIKKMRAERSKALREEVQTRRAASAPAPAQRSSRYLRDLESGMHPRTAKKAEKDRQRAAEHQRRVASKRPTEGEHPDESRKKGPNPHKHRGGRERSEKKRKMYQQQGRLTVQEEEDLIAVQMAELNESPEVKNQIADVLRNAYLEKYGSEPGPSGSKGPAKPASESESANDDDDDDDQTDSSMVRLREQFGQDLEIEPELQDVIHKTLTERHESKKREEGRIDSEERERQRRATKDLERKNREKYEREKKENERKDRERKELEKKEIERKIREIRKRDPKKEDEKSRPAPRSSAPPQQPADAPRWIQPDGTLKPFKEIHKISQWSEEGSTEVYVSCLTCQNTIKGAEPYSLWAHVEIKRCYPENAIKGWRQQAKQKEQQAKIDEAYKATAKEAARKMSKGRGQTPVPPIYPARPPPPKPTETIELTGNEQLEEITSFETKKPKEERTRVVEVRDERDRNKEKPKKRSVSAPPLDDEAGVGDVGERSNPIRLKSRSRTPSRSPSRAASALAGGIGPAVLKAATEAAKSARSAVLNLRGGRDPAPKDSKKEKPPIEERLSLPEFPKEGEEPRISPMRIVPSQVERPEGSDESDQGDWRRRRFRYEDPSSESELNAIDHGKSLESVEAV